MINSITIFNIFSLKPEKVIPNIDSINSTNCFLLFKQYIVINCKNGIALFLIKTKEIIQYIKNINDISENKEIILDNKENICILSKIMKTNMLLFNVGYYLKIIKLNMIEGLFEPFEGYENIETNENLKIICINDGDFILWGDNLYILKDGEKNHYY